MLTPTPCCVTANIVITSQLRRSTNDSCWLWMLSSSSNMTPGELTIRRPCRIGKHRHHDDILYFGPFECVDQTAFANVVEANDADGDALRRTQFIRLEEGEQGGGMCPKLG
jgi:hypothetical protein